MAHDQKKSGHPWYKGMSRLRSCFFINSYKSESVSCHYKGHYISTNSQIAVLLGKRLNQTSIEINGSPALHSPTT